MRFTPPPPKDSFHEETLFSCFVGKRVRDASIYVSKKYRSSFYSRAIATIATVSVSAMLVSMRQKKSLKFLFLSDIFLFPPIRQQVPILA